MTTSKKQPTEAFVWVWLPKKTKPVVAGRLFAAGEQLLFNYGRSYLGRNDAISLYEPELPLRAEVLPLTPGLTMPNCLRMLLPTPGGAASSSTVCSEEAARAPTRRRSTN